MSRLSYIVRSVLLSLVLAASGEGAMCRTLEYSSKANEETAAGAAAR